MKLTTTRILLVALLAGGLGVLTRLWWIGSPLLHSKPWALTGVDVSEVDKHQAPPATAASIPIGAVLPVIKVRSLDYHPIDLSAQHTGQVRLLNFWASWCRPCVEEMPALDRFARSQGNTGVQVIGLALDEPMLVKQFLLQVPVQYPIYLETPSSTDASVRLGNRRGALPFSVLISADGRLLKQKYGPFESGEIETWIQP